MLFTHTVHRKPFATCSLAVLIWFAYCLSRAWYHLYRLHHALPVLHVSLLCHHACAACTALFWLCVILCTACTACTAAQCLYCLYSLPDRPRWLPCHSPRQPREGAAAVLPGLVGGPRPSLDQVCHCSPGRDGSKVQRRVLGPTQGGEARMVSLCGSSGMHMDSAFCMAATKRCNNACGFGVCEVHGCKEHKRSGFWVDGFRALMLWHGWQWAFCGYYLHSGAPCYASWNTYTSF